jgi:hypothetical protein
MIIKTAGREKGELLPPTEGNREIPLGKAVIHAIGKVGHSESNMIDN